MLPTLTGCLPIPYHPAFGPETRDYSKFGQMTVATYDGRRFRYATITSEPANGGKLAWQPLLAAATQPSRALTDSEMAHLRQACSAVAVRDYFVFPTPFCKDQPAHGVNWDNKSVGVRPICVWSTAFDGGIDGDFARIVSVIDELIAALPEPMGATTVDSAAVNQGSL